MAAASDSPPTKRARKDETKGSEDETYLPPARVSDGANIVGMDAYRREYARSVSDPVGFWAEKAKKYITWWRLPADIYRGSFEVGDIEWFPGKIALSSCI